MMESEDEDLPLDSKHTIHAQKRQKYAKSHLIGTREEAFPTAGRGSKAFRYLQEQREQLPIARGGTITNLHNIVNASEFCPSLYQGASHSCAVSH
jgi:hypothetical protein